MQHTDNDFKIVIEGKRTDEIRSEMMMSIYGSLGLTNFYQIAKVMMRAYLDRPGITMGENTYILGLLSWLKDKSQDYIMIDMKETMDQAKAERGANGAD